MNRPGIAGGCPGHASDQQFDDARQLGREQCGPDLAEPVDGGDHVALIDVGCFPARSGEGLCDDLGRAPEAAVPVLHNDVLPFYAALDLPVTAVLTDNRWPGGHRSDLRRRRGQKAAEGRELCGTARHPFELYLALSDIEHRKVSVSTPRTTGFVERFNDTVLEEFFTPATRRTVYENVDALQADLDAWLVHYNRERPHLGYRNQVRMPWDTIQQIVSQEG